MSDPTLPTGPMEPSPPPPAPPPVIVPPPAPVLHQDYAVKFSTCVIHTDRVAEVMHVCDEILTRRSVYDRIAAFTKVPWWFTGPIHYRESALNLGTYLGNGQLLGHMTTIAPKGRGPFFGPNAFFDGAVDAYRLLHFDKVVDWGIGNALYLAEEWNGEGYHLHGIPSPYVWGGTNIQVPGKYISDGRFAAGVWDIQLGVAAIIKGLYIKVGKL